LARAIKSAQTKKKKSQYPKKKKKEKAFLGWGTLLDVFDVAGGEGDADSVDFGCCLGLFGVLFGGAFSDCLSVRFL
jgi:hypothetical protein